MQLFLIVYYADTPPLSCFLVVSTIAIFFLFKYYCYDTII